MLDEKGCLKIMPKLIIPNQYELYQFDNYLLTQEEINARYFYNLRFLWLLEPGDAIILPQLPARGFLSYLAKMKNINPASLHIVVLDAKYKPLHSDALSDVELINQLRNIMAIPSQWKIQTCYFNSAILALSKKLYLTIDPEWEKFIKADLVHTLNSKAEFRKISEENGIPITEGVVVLRLNSWSYHSRNF